MIGRTLPLVALLLALAAAPLAWAAPPGAGCGARDLGEAIERAREAGGGPFRLGVECRADAGMRRLEVFPSGVAIWDRSSQIALGAETRAALLEALATHRFASLAERYGGPSGAQRGPLRVSCRVTLEIGGFTRSSVQFADGEQSAALAGLAAALLDRVAPLAKEGVTAADLADGLSKLASGALAPEAFELRFVRLPADGRGGPGSLLRLEGLEFATRAYEPGREIGAEETRALDRERFSALAATLVGARLAQLPVNLWSDEYLELEVGVLQHRQTVTARRFGRLGPGSDADARERFRAVVAALDALASTSAPTTP
ncbi:MAG: hypothetical protein AB1625_02595 [Acidobacteriota bacterium]